MDGLEIWRPIRGYEGLYEVSNLGQVKRLTQFVDNIRGKQRYKRKWDGRILKFDSVRKAKRVCLTKNNISKRYFVHRLVATAFIPNHLNKPEVNHIDGNPSNNKIDNLEWCTGSENIVHSYKVLKRENGFKKGAQHHCAKLNKDNVIEIRKSYKSGVSIRSLASKFGVTEQHTKDICNNKKWKWLNENSA